jgi:lipoprotein NlpD
MAVITKWRAGALVVCCVALLVGCSSPRTKAPVEERVATAPAPVPVPVPVPVVADPPALPPPAPAAAASAASAPLPGAENAGKPGPVSSDA